MRTLYIDHSIVAHEPSWESLRRAIEPGGIRLALSVWNLVEIGNATDEAQRDRRLAFLVDELRPLWIVERRDIQRQEIERFLWQHKFGAVPRQLIAITPTLSIVQSFFAGAQLQIGLTARQFIRETDLASLRPLRRLTRDALKTWQSADRKLRSRKEQEIFHAWLGTLIPDYGPGERALTSSAKAECLAFCWRYRKQLFLNCRCLAAEDALTTARTNDPERQPTESDALDLQHAAVALAYCDVLYSRDGYQNHCAAIALNLLNRMKLGSVCSTPETLAAAIAAL